MKKRNGWKEKAGKIAQILPFYLLAALMVIMCVFYFHMRKRESQVLQKVQDAEEYSSYYMMITNDDSLPFWQNVYAGALEEAQKADAYIEMPGLNLETDYDKRDLMKIAIDSKVDGIIVEADESAMMTELIREAEDNGIPVVTVLEDNTQAGRQSYVSISYYNLGREYGNQLCDIIREKQVKGYGSRQNVMVLLDAERADTSQSILLASMQEVIDGEGFGDLVQIEAVPVQSGSAFAAEEAIRDIFMTRDTLPDVMICLNEQNTTCAYQAVVDYNKVGDIEIVGYYESDMIRSAIRKDIIYSSVTFDTKQMGRYCVDALTEYQESGYANEYFAVDISLLDAQTLGEGGADDVQETD